mmetsp:Transcript_17594/g.45155  ORF Transcript_17594/g.45155 Transcript_17594/m.45155 type:complete len:84 (-) Transcript_17594:307-558(-)
MQTADPISDLHVETSATSSSQELSPRRPGWAAASPTELSTPSPPELIRSSSEHSRREVRGVTHAFGMCELHCIASWCPHQHVE